MQRSLMRAASSLQVKSKGSVSQLLKRSSRAFRSSVVIYRYFTKLALTRYSTLTLIAHWLWQQKYKNLPTKRQMKISFNAAMIMPSDLLGMPLPNKLLRYASKFYGQNNLPMTMAQDESWAIAP